MAAPWVLILGASSGFGAASARAFARAGYNVAGVHLDRRSAMGPVEALQAEIVALGRECRLFNVNAADDEQRAGVVAALAGCEVRVLLHSLAFGSLVPFVPEAGKAITRKQLEMTMDVMAHSLVYWTQDVVAAGLLGQGGRIYAMTSSGSHVAWHGYGAVSAAKSALESHVRQLAMELGGRGITANSVLAGVTRTPALEKIPGSDALAATAERRNPHRRLTQPDDVARALVKLADADLYWLNGGVLHLDGGEDVSG